MTTSKSRPLNNHHCFEGVGRIYWHAFATGRKPVDVRLGPTGARLEFHADDDGFALQNGGMSMPKETKLAPGRYFRFFGTVAHNRFGAASSMAGGWWLDFDNLCKVVNWAEQFDLSIGSVAQID